MWVCGTVPCVRRGTPGAGLRFGLGGGVVVVVCECAVCAVGGGLGFGWVVVVVCCMERARESLWAQEMTTNATCIYPPSTMNTNSIAWLPAACAGSTYRPSRRCGLFGAGICS